MCLSALGCCFALKWSSFGWFVRECVWLQSKASSSVVFYDRKGKGEKKHFLFIQLVPSTALLTDTH